jgi:hypothetical protein
MQQPPTLQGQQLLAVVRQLVDGLMHIGQAVWRCAFLKLA